MTKEESAKYAIKAKDSFKTKKNLFVFSLAVGANHTFTYDEFNDFKITDDLVKQYTSEYWQEYEDHIISNWTIKEIAEKIKRIEANNIELLKLCEVNYVENFDDIFPKNQFVHLIRKEREKGCYYCHITEGEIEKLGIKQKLNKKSFRGWSLEIDRLNSNFEYTNENCVMACYWCNNAKTDEFTKEEFLEIGKVIQQIWEKRLNDN